jgi:hypothetical protein
VFQSFAAMLDEADAALTRAGSFIRNQLRGARYGSRASTNGVESAQAAHG